MESEIERPNDLGINRAYPNVPDGNRRKQNAYNQMYEETKKRIGSKDDFSEQPLHSSSFQDYQHKEMSLHSVDLMRPG
jgi:hypothetical protein